MKNDLFVLILVAVFLGAGSALSQKEIPIDSLAASPDAACAIYEGGVYCWGNVEGLYGKGSGDKAQTPVSLPGMRGIVQLDLTSGHGCGVRVDGRVLCFGTNDSGELGSANYRKGGRRVVRNVSSASEVKVGGSTHTREGGSGFACARLVNGDVKCWGANDRGQTQPVGTHTLMPTKVDVGGAVSIAAGEDFACAVDAEGAARCWGHGILEPKMIAQDARRVDASGTRVCITTQNAVKCGEIFEPLKRVFAFSAQKVSLGVDHLCAASNDTLYCSGKDWGGVVSLAKRGQKIRSIASGFQFSCVENNEGISCWGNNYSGALGSLPTSEQARRQSPMKVRIQSERR